MSRDASAHVSVAAFTRGELIGEIDPFFAAGAVLPVVT